MARDLQIFYDEVGQRLRKAREDRGMTQEAIASQVGLTRTSMTNIEKGRQRVALHTLVDLAQVLGSSLTALLPDCDTPSPTVPNAAVPVFNRAEVASLVKDHPQDEQEWIMSALLENNEEAHGNISST